MARVTIGDNVWIGGNSEGMYTSDMEGWQLDIMITTYGLLDEEIPVHKS